MTPALLARALPPASFARGQGVEKQAQMALSVFMIYSFSRISVKKVTEKSWLQKELREN
ncbi:sulfate permease [Cereibacter johrii]|uniref:sulfate permease n=1 Tax=Cereibacter johrii TaxID=445629 RepID=UPI000B094E61|nr:sulfate permease [Cereibacter johrii]